MNWDSATALLELTIDTILLFLLVILASAIVASKSLFSATMLSGLYSLLMALVWVNMAAMDVAFTEAAVGAGISTILFLGALVRTGTREKSPPKIHWRAFGVVVATGCVLVYGTVDMPFYGDRNSPINLRVAPEYVNQTVAKKTELERVPSPPRGENEFDSHVNNLVTAVLADYRSFDTMFEAGVIFTAGAALVLLLRRRERPLDALEATSEKAAPSREGGTT